MGSSLEDLMCGLTARLGALAEVIASNVLYTLATLGLNVLAIWLVASVQTREAFIFVPFLVAASLAMAGKGAVLLHRKWSEYEAMEQEAQGLNLEIDPVLINPMLKVAKRSKLFVAVCDTTAVLMIAPVTLWLSLSALANYFPADFWPVLILSATGCAIGASVWVMAPNSNKQPAKKTTKKTTQAWTDPDGE